MAIGNAVGSVSANTGIILAISLFFLPGSNQKTGLYYKNNSIYRNPRITSDKFQRQSI